MLNTDFSPWPSFTQEEADAVSNILLSNKVNYWTGTEARKFEDEYANWAGTKYAIALANGTVALELALKSLNIGPGDEVIVTPRTFIASVSCIISVGAKPIFADVDLDSQNITALTIEPVITNKTKAIICVHLAGWPCEMDEIQALADEHNLYIIEDCAQAHGALYRGASVGSMGNAGAWSFCQDKIITTGGEGGMLTLNDEDVWSRAWAYKDHGKSYQAVYHQEHPAGFRWLHQSFGTNMRMTEMQAAIGRIQLRKMPEWHKKRKLHAEKIYQCARQYALFRVPVIPKHIEHAWYRCYLFIQPEALAKDWSRDRIIHEFNSLGVPCYSGTCSEVYLEHAFDGLAIRPDKPLTNAQQLGEVSLMFLVHPTLTTEEIDKTVNMIEHVAGLASREEKK
ncbi:MAG: DegT/DnrJ/EryC1/StrS aminotransferase family protein [Gammaproteobacteria bacterium]|nr:DegT/DnrJ/EryC1/StrS aminotransferase family protein [Gammaproteobacteria bacterium]